MNSSQRWILVALLLLPLSTSAEELKLGVNTGVAFDDNVSSSEFDEQNDYSGRIGPHLALEDTDGVVQWKFRYRPSFDYYIYTRELRGWTQHADGLLSWQIDPSTRLTLSDRLGRFRSLNAFNETVAAGEADAVADTRTAFLIDRNIRNTFNATLTHSLDPNTILSLDLGHNMIEFSRDERSDRQTLSASAHYQRRGSPRNTLGVGGAYRRSALDSATDSDGATIRRSQSTDFYNLFLSWQHQFDETLDLSLAAGPTWVDGDDQPDLDPVIQSRQYPLIRAESRRNRLVSASSCPTDDGVHILIAGCEAIDENPLAFVLVDGFPRAFYDQRALDSWNPIRELRLEGSAPSRSTSSLTYFANASLNKRWEQWTGSLSYRRQQSDSTGLGSSTVADIVTGVLVWTPSRRWHSTLRSSLTRQTQATEGVQSVPALSQVNLNTAIPGLIGTLGPEFTDVAEAFALQAVKVDQDLDILTLWVRLSVRYRLTKWITLVGDATYWDQETDGSAIVGREYERFRVKLGVEYSFEPIHL